MARKNNRTRRADRVPAPVAEMIGRGGPAYRGYQYPNMALPSVDWTRPDYAYWDQLWRGKLTALRLGSLFAKPITQHIASWTLGKGFIPFTGHAATDGALQEFASDGLRELLGVYLGGLRLGDAYVVVNPDGTMTSVPPNQVEIEVDKLDYRRVLSYKITTVLEKATLTDEYRLGKRIVTVKEGGNPPVTREYATPIDLIPVAHNANERGINEVYGHPIYEPLLPTWMHYDDTLDKGLKGVKAISVPIMVYEDVDHVDDMQGDLGAQERTYRNHDGDTRSMFEIDMPSAPMLFSSTGKINFKGPAPFVGELRQALEILFYLTLEHVGVPEWIWGGHLNAARASVDSQVPAWEAQVDHWRTEIEPFLINVCDIWLRWRALVDPRIRVLPVGIKYPPVTSKDIKDVLAAVEFALANALITDETALGELDIVEDTVAEVKAARQQAQERMSDAQRFDQSMQQQAGQLDAGDPQTGL